MPPSKKFRIQAKNYFLTYPHRSLTKDEALTQLQNISTPVNKLFIRVSRELHEDGEPHLHVLKEVANLPTIHTQRPLIQDPPLMPLKY